MVGRLADFRRFDVVLVELDPTLGAEIRNTRPCLIVSPDEMNDSLRTIIVAPMTTWGKARPMRIPFRFGGNAGFVAIDQLRAIDRGRIVRKLGRMSGATTRAVLSSLRAMFEE